MPTDLEVLRAASELLGSLRGAFPAAPERTQVLDVIVGQLDAMADRMDSERAQPGPGATPEGEGWLKPWVPQPGVTFLAEGASVRSLVALEPPPARGIVGVDVPGKWNHGARDNLSLICHADVAEEWGRYLVDAAGAARRDETAYREQHG